MISGEEIDSGDSSQDGSSVVPHGLEDISVATMFFGYLHELMQHITLSLLYILHNLVCTHGDVQVGKINEKAGGNNMNL